MKFFRILAALLILLTWTHALLADSGGAPDVVMMRDGSFYRGTISEKTADEVEIVLISGKIRTLSMQEVQYAGPVNDAPSSNSDTTEKRDEEHKYIVTVRGEEARLKLEGAQPGLTYHRRAASAEAIAVGPGGTALARSVGYDEMCTAPCEVTMPAGTHTLALSQEGGQPVQAEPVTLPPGSSTLQGNYVSKASVRTAGVFIAVAGSIIGAAIFLSSVKDAAKSSRTPMYVGGGVMLGSVAIGAPMMYVSDRADIRVAGRSTPRISHGVTFTGVF